MPKVIDPAEIQAIIDAHVVLPRMNEIIAAAIAEYINGDEWTTAEDIAGKLNLEKSDMETITVVPTRKKK